MIEDNVVFLMWEEFPERRRFLSKIKHLKPFITNDPVALLLENGYGVPCIYCGEPCLPNKNGNYCILPKGKRCTRSYFKSNQRAKCPICKDYFTMKAANHTYCKSECKRANELRVLRIKNNRWISNRRLFRRKLTSIFNKFKVPTSYRRELRDTLVEELFTTTTYENYNFENFHRYIHYALIDFGVPYSLEEWGSSNMRFKFQEDIFYLSIKQEYGEKFFREYFAGTELVGEEDEQ
jgi:hypothetical protein